MNTRTLSLAFFAAAGVAAAATVAANRSRRPSYSLFGRTVLVTGGSRGLGFRLASLCAAEGAHVVICARTERELERARQAIAEAGGSVEAVVCDLRQPAAIQRLIDHVIAAHGTIDVLINNAGIIQVTPFEHAQIADFEESMAVHFWAPLRLARACVPVMRRNGGGRIVNIASIGGRLGVPHLAPYCAGKFALAGLSDTLHAELAKDNIIVTTVTPYLMRTGSYGRALVRGRQQPEAQWFAAASATPLTAMSADRAARQIIDACKAGRARLTPGIEARLAEIVSVCLPETFAGIASLVAEALPAPAETTAGDAAAPLKDVDLGWVDLLTSAQR
jgi:short-subunit dehydrogenase